MRGVGLNTKVKVISHFPLASGWYTGGRTRHPALPQTAVQLLARREAAAGGTGGVPGRAGHRLTAPTQLQGSRSTARRCVCHCQLTEAETERAAWPFPSRFSRLQEPEPQAPAEGPREEIGAEESQSLLQSILQTPGFQTFMCMCISRGAG